LKQWTPATDNTILTVVNLDPHHAQSGWLDLDLEPARHRRGLSISGARSA
jgi:hypothetical protein